MTGMQPTAGKLGGREFGKRSRGNPALSIGELSLTLDQRPWLGLGSFRIWVVVALRRLQFVGSKTDSGEDNDVRAEPDQGDQQTVRNECLCTEGI